MLKDRAQKASALRLCVSKRWFPQMEVEVEPAQSFEKSKTLLTDLDVLAVAPAPVGPHIRVLFDSKSGERESAIHRAFWLHGVLTRVSGAQGFVILNDKVRIQRDHRVSAADLTVSLVHESEFADLAKGIGGTIAPGHSAAITRRIVNEMKESGVLLSRIGPYDNVLKIRPPMVFTTENADLLLETFDSVLSEVS